VLTRLEVAGLLGEMSGRERVMATLLYGSGLRLLRVLATARQGHRLREARNRVRAGKGDKDRMTMLPESARQPLARHLESVRRQYESDLAVGLSRCDAAWRDRHQVPERRPRVGVAIRIPGFETRRIAEATRDGATPHDQTVLSEGHAGRP